MFALVLYPLSILHFLEACAFNLYLTLGFPAVCSSAAASIFAIVFHSCGSYYCPSGLCSAFVLLLGFYYAIKKHSQINIVLRTPCVSLKQVKKIWQQKKQQK